MAQFPHSTLTILRRRQVQAETGYSRSTIYLRITQGLWPKPVSLGARAVGWPAGEVSALNAARIAGKSDDEIRALVVNSGNGTPDRVQRPVAWTCEFNPSQAMRHPNHRLVKTHRTYTVEEIARLFHVHRNTVREWVKRGLPTCDDRRPMLILGPELAAFLQARRLKNRQTCSPGELYCVRCRAPRVPAGNMADYQPKTASLGTLIGICSQCDCMMYRRVNPSKLEQIRGPLDITLPQARSRIDESPGPSVNSDFQPSVPTHDKAQPE